MKPNSKFKPVTIASREAMTTVVNAYVRDRLAHTSIQLKMEQEMAEVQKKYQGSLDALARGIACAEAGLQVWAETHRETEFAEKKSIDLQLAVIGFRETPYRVEKVKAKDTFDTIALRMAAFEIKDESGNVIFSGDDYVRYSDPDLDKKALLADRQNIPPAALKAAGIAFAKDEVFYIEPKSEIVEGMKAEVAA